MALARGRFAELWAEFARALTKRRLTVALGVANMFSEVLDEVVPRLGLEPRTN